MAPRVVLVGMPGSGKTTVGRAVAAALGCTFVDADDEIVRRQGRAIADIFATDGEAAFRAVEADAIGDLLAVEDGVVSLGGGSVLNEITRRRLAGHPVVWLRTDLASLVERMTAAEASDRPLLAGDVAQRLADLDGARRRLYEQVASAVVDTGAGSPESVAADVLASIEATATR